MEYLKKAMQTMDPPQKKRQCHEKKIEKKENHLSGGNAYFIGIEHQTGGDDKPGP